MSACIQSETNDWEKSPMKQGKLYLSICEREVVEEKLLHRFFHADEINDVIEVIDTKSPVVFLEKTITRQADKYNGDEMYQTFIKILTAAGNVGWAIWFKDEWKEVKSCQ
jgi:hypothetical protein